MATQEKLQVGTVVSNSHSTASTPGGGVVSTAQTAQTVTLGKCSLSRLLGGRSVICFQRIFSVASRATCPARAPI